MAESATKFAKKNIDIDEFLKQVINVGEDTLQKTPELLPVLKKAGVVDSGGRGLIIIFTGFYKILIGDETLKINFDQDKVSSDLNVDFGGENPANIQDLGDIQFAYCTEYFVIEMKKKTTEADIDKLRERLMEIGDSVICVGDLSLVKVHVHTNEPNKALGYALELGELTKLKIENMLEQNRAMKRLREKEKALKHYGMVSVCAGEGLSAIFKDLNVDKVIEGGQTMNPSADDIVKAIDSVGAKDVFVFPNNKNIILAAEQAKALTNTNIHVIPTRSIPEGISACLAFNPEATPAENEELMMDGLKNVHSYSVTYAVRDTKVNGFSLKQGDIIGLNDKAIVAKGKNVEDAVVKLIDKQINEDIVTISLFFGENTTEDEANALAQKIQTKYPDCEVSAMFGGQPVYYYIICME